MPRQHDGSRPKGMMQEFEARGDTPGDPDTKHTPINTKGSEKPIDTSVLNDPYLTELMEVAEREADRYETPNARVMAYQNGILAGIGTHLARLRGDTQNAGEKVVGTVVTFGLVTAVLLIVILWRVW